MRTILALLMVVLVSAPAARAEQLAPDVASKLPMPETVYCAVDEADWQAQVQRLHGVPGARGVTQVVSGTIHLPASTCAALRVPFYAGATMDYRVFYHEFVHAAFHTLDESVADCVSLFMYRYWVRRFFGASAADANAAYGVAWADHLRSPPNYQGSCAFESRDLVSPLNGF